MKERYYFNMHSLLRNIRTIDFYTTVLLSLKRVKFITTVDYNDSYQLLL